MTPLPLLLLLVAAALGWGPAGRWLGARGGERILYGGLLGVLLLYGALWGADLLGIPWSPLGVLACLAAAGAVSLSGRLPYGAPVGLLLFTLAVGSAKLTGTQLSTSGVSACLAVALAVSLLGGRRDRKASTPGDIPRAVAPIAHLGDAVAAAAVLAFGVAGARLWNLHADFVYHWGAKGQRFFLAGGIDWEYLARPWNGHLHPDYPNLLPSLFAAGAALAGRFDAASTALTSVVFFALLVLAIRSVLRSAAADGLTTALGVAGIAWGAAMFGIGFDQAGGADLLMALAACAGVAVLVGPADVAADRRMAVVAAVAAGSKIEGVPLAALLLAAHLLRRGPVRQGWRSAIAIGLPIALRSAWLPTLVIGAWLAQTLHHGLFLDTNTGGLDPGRLPIVLSGIWNAMQVGPWHGLPFALAVLPWLALRRHVCWGALVLLAQAGFYLVVYLTSPVDTALLVLTSAPRLLFHLVPATLALGVAELVHWADGPVTDEGSGTAAERRL
ncbi:MAG: hypothetical protein AAGN66_12510 [Acidobacteriota bacterium]